MSLSIKGINTYIKESHILQGVTMDLVQKETVALLGRNGVGKSTTVKSIMGLTPPRKGSIQFKGQEIAGKKVYEISRLGIGYVPEDRRIFSNLTVRQNLLIGMKGSKKQQGDQLWGIEAIYNNFPQLEKRDSSKARNLSGGEQQMLAIGRALMGNPELLLVDEPMEGLAPSLVEMVVEILHEINKTGTSILIIEQKFDLVMDLAERAYVMNKGKIVFRGTTEELIHDREVQKRYLQV